MNWSQKIIVISGSAFILLTIFTLFSRISEWTHGWQEAKVINPVSYVGVYDPSIEYPDEGFGWMAFTALTRDRGAPESKIDIGIDIAMSANGGKSWTYMNTAFEGKPGEITTSAQVEPLSVGEWRYEMPSLVYDPQDKGKEWKLFAYRYFWDGDIERARQYGMITYKYAPEPTKGWSKEVWLFGANEKYPPYPYSALVKLSLNKLSPDLDDISYFADPGVLVKDGVILMTLSAYKQADRPDRVIMVASTDHGQSWSYIGTILTAEDIAKIGDYNRMGGGSLFIEGDEVYFMISPGDDRLENQGVLVFAFDHLAKAKLRRGKNGLLDVVNYIPLPDDILVTRYGGGQGDYHERNTVGGLVMPVSVSERFHLLNTRMSPVTGE